MKIELEHLGTKVILLYDDNGVLDHVINTETNTKMILETYQEGNGYEFGKGYMFIKKTCSATYFRIMELDLFIPKFLFILANSE